MKLLVISSPGGSGHVQVANAIVAEAANYPTISEVQHINIASFLPHTLNALLFESYDWSAKFFPLWWRIVYILTNTSLGTWCAKKIAVLLMRTGVGKLGELKQLLATFQPDCIICTNPIPRLFLRHSNTKQICMVLTDYDAHATWVQDSRDTFFVSAQDVLAEVIQKGALRTHTIVTGIPIHPVFFEEKNRETLYQTYNIDKNKKTVLILTGGHGLFNPTKHITALNASALPLTIIVIAGKNKALQKELEQLTIHSKHTYHVLGWTNTMDEYMRIADYVITKPGGITTTECLVLQKPMILVSPIPGQEEANCRVLCRIGAAVRAHKPADILKYLNAQYTIQKKSPNASQVILDIITQINH